MMNICRACSGSCCEKFPLYQNTVNIETGEIENKKYFTHMDIEFLWNHRKGFNGIRCHPEEDYYFFCIHYKDNLCAIYDERPDTCRNHLCDDYDVIMSLILTDKHEVMEVMYG